MCDPRPPRAIGVLVEVLPSRPSFSLRQPLTTRAWRHCNCANDLQSLSVWPWGPRPRPFAHRINLDVEFVLGLPYSAKTLPFRNKNRLVGLLLLSGAWIRMSVWQLHRTERRRDILRQLS
ncbi:uncharacterized protein EI97DRAFT_223670 [Westerdykella ornata]|uniref:Uncharacterized protein n=1 Tax=Westerdykella ornata TaxID=318751 RepID=A0A6A6JRQ8_WESOR|nr:uncharacterized protein EI97DRAFT_223670 [Westerdykella ornata]KAF2278935.1 hypothetical protein EI97DRAFT_223670 [Westerdykella ornata]